MVITKRTAPTATVGKRVSGQRDWQRRSLIMLVASIPSLIESWVLDLVLVRSAFPTPACGRLPTYRRGRAHATRPSDPKRRCATREGRLPVMVAHARCRCQPWFCVCEWVCETRVGGMWVSASGLFWGIGEWSVWVGCVPHTRAGAVPRRRSLPSTVCEGSQRLEAVLPACPGYFCILMAPPIGNLHRERAG